MPRTPRDPPGRGVAAAKFERRSDPARIFTPELLSRISPRPGVWFFPADSGVSNQHALCGVNAPYSVMEFVQ